MSYVYIRSEPQLWTVGFYRPDGKWEAESDHDSPEAAAARTAYMNGRDARAERVTAMVNALPVTTEELRRLRNAGKITFDKMVHAITTCLIDMREVSAGSQSNQSSEPQS